MLREYLVHARLFTRNARLFLAGSFFFGFGFGTFWVLENLYLREVGLTESAIGRVLSAQSLGTLLAAPLAGYLSRRFAYRHLLMVAACLTVAAYVGISFGETSAVLLPAASVAGAGFALHHILAAPFFMRNSGPRERIYLFGLSWALEMTATVIATGGSGWLARILENSLGSPLLGLRYTLLTAAGLTALTLFPYSRIGPPVGKPEEDHPTRHRNRPLVRTLFRLALPSFLVGSGAGLVIPFLNLYFRDRFDLGPGRIGSLFAVGQALTAVGFLVGPVVARRIGMIRTVVTAELASIPFLLLMAFTRSLPAAVTGFWMRGALMNMNHPIASNFAMELVGPSRQALTNSVLMVAWNGAWMVSTQLGGILIEHHGFTLPMVITVSLYFVSSLLYLAFFHDTEKEFTAREPEAAP